MLRPAGPRRLAGGAVAWTTPWMPPARTEYGGLLYGVPVWRGLLCRACSRCEASPASARAATAGSPGCRCGDGVGDGREGRS